MRLTIEFSADPSEERFIAKCLEFPKIEANGFDAQEALEELIYLLDMVEALPTLEKLEEAPHDR